MIKCNIPRYLICIMRVLSAIIRRGSIGSHRANTSYAHFIMFVALAWDTMDRAVLLHIRLKHVIIQDLRYTHPYFRDKILSITYIGFFLIFF